MIVDLFMAFQASQSIYSKGNRSERQVPEVAERIQGEKHRCSTRQRGNQGRSIKNPGEIRKRSER